MRNEGSLACHTYSDIWLPATITPVAEGLEVELSLDLLRLGFEHPTFRIRGERS